MSDVPMVPSLEERVDQLEKRQLAIIEEGRELKTALIALKQRQDTLVDNVDVATRKLRKTIRQLFRQLERHEGTRQEKLVAARETR